MVLVVWVLYPAALLLGIVVLGGGSGGDVSPLSWSCGRGGA